MLARIYSRKRLPCEGCYSYIEFNQPLIHVKGKDDNGAELQLYYHNTQCADKDEARKIGKYTDCFLIEDKKI